jgi:hypothetical protein
MLQSPMIDDNLSMISALSDDDFNIDSTSEIQCGSRMEWITDDNESSALPNQCRFVRPPAMPRRVNSISSRTATLDHVSPRGRPAMTASLDASPREGPAMNMVDVLSPREGPAMNMDPPMLVVAPQQEEGLLESTTVTTATSTGISALTPLGMESSAATCSTSTSISSPPRAAAKFIEPVEILPHRLQSKDCLPVLQGVSPPPKPQRLQSVEDLTSRTSESSGESIPVHDANLPSLPSIPQRRCSLIL